MLKIISVRRTSFLGSWVFLFPLIRVIRDRDVDIGRGSLGRLVADMMPESEDFIQDHFSHLLHIINNLKSEVECFGACWLIGSIVPDVQISMFQSVLDIDA